MKLHKTVICLIYALIVNRDVQEYFTEWELGISILLLLLLHRQSDLHVKLISIHSPQKLLTLYSTKIINSVQVTGSHNPSEYNGLKISFNKKPFYGKDIKKLHEIIKNNDFIDNDEKGSLSHFNILDNYKSYMYDNIFINKMSQIHIERLKSQIKTKKKLFHLNSKITSIGSKHE